jgi:hypothetical protein
MSFLAPALLFALPLAALPVIIHLIHLHRRRTIEWAAMMFLLAAQQMNRGYSRLRQMLILAFRVLAVLGLILLMARPLAGGWLGLTGGAPDTVLVLLDRSASMEQQNLATGESKRSSAVKKIAQGIEDMFGSRTKVVLIDSATNEPTAIENPKALIDLPATQPTDTTADFPALMQSALDYITTNQLGRTDVWMASDLRQADWNPTSGRWEALRGAFAKLEAVRFHLIAYPQPADDNVAVQVDRVARRETSDKAELMLDIRLTRHSRDPQPVELPLQVVVNGTRSTMKAMLTENELVLQGQAVPLDKTVKRGWGRIELPADSNLRDNVFDFVFDQPSMPLSVIVSDDPDVIDPLSAVLASPIEPGRKQQVVALGTSRASEIDWDKSALVVWQAPLPAADDILAKQLSNHVAQGRTVIFLPPLTSIGDGSVFGVKWGAWKDVPKVENASAIEWWRASDDLLANSRGGTALPVGELEVLRHCEIVGEASPLARLASGGLLMARAGSEQSGGAWFCGTLPGSAQSSFARDGIVFYAMMQRALIAGAKTLGNAQLREAGPQVLASNTTWKQADGTEVPVSPLVSGVLASNDRLMALNRPLREDSPALVSDEQVKELFAGLQFRRIDDEVENENALANEIWRTFLMLMALALIGEAILCLPGKKDAQRAETKREVMA